MFVHSLSDKMQTEYFDVLYHHLQKPVEDHSCKDEESFLWTLWSLRGVTELGCPYFERDAAHKHRFTECWPNIVKWLKAILDVGQFYGEENQYFTLAGDAFDIGVFVHEGAPLDNDGVMELGVRVWIGTKASDGSDQYSSRSLLACLMVSEKMRGGRSPSYRSGITCLQYGRASFDQQDPCTTQTRDISLLSQESRQGGHSYHYDGAPRGSTRDIINYGDPQSQRGAHFGFHYKGYY